MIAVSDTFADVAALTGIDVASPVGPQVVRDLRERIIRAELAPGTRLTEQELAAHYRLSRQPIREAFIKLAEEGLLEIRPQRGSFVRKISVAEVMDSRFVREAIEADIVRLLAEHIGRDEIGELRRQIARQRAAVDEEPAVFLRLDESFHRTLAEAAGKVRVWSLLEDIKAQMDRVRYLSMAEFPSVLLVEQHEAIVAAIASGDADAAEAAMRNHLRKVLDDLPAIAAAHPGYFERA
ncbi:GntR family transcriptional regulator [Consotaella aegiceratis]|uniref:GntR family transcriptional regulator n=1 Tax=Consotaella aegiceratis TaxID=3097961 RepID=UPI002F3E5E7F